MTHKCHNCGDSHVTLHIIPTRYGGDGAIQICRDCIKFFNFRGSRFSQWRPSEAQG